MMLISFARREDRDLQTRQIQYQRTHRARARETNSTGFAAENEKT